MKQVISEGCRVPIKLWVTNVEENAQYILKLDKSWQVSK